MQARPSTDNATFADVFLRRLAEGIPAEVLNYELANALHAIAWAQVQNDAAARAHTAKMLAGLAIAIDPDVTVGLQGVQ